MFRTFYKLQPAVELANQYKCGVWAEDLPNGKKKFRVATFPRILEYCTKALKPSLYELIGEGCHTRLYFDIEIHQYQQESLNDFVILKNLELLQMEPDLREVYLLNSINEITEDFCRYFLDFFRSTLRNYVHRTLGILITDNEITVLSACRISKLSFHIVCPSIVFDRHNTSLAFYVEDFAYYFVNVIKAEFLSPETDQTRKGHLIRCLCLNQGKAFAIDLAPYGKNQQFRMFGCGKVGKAPLRLIQNETTSLLPPINFNWNFGQMWGDLVNNEKNTIFAQYGVQLNLEETPIHISPGKSVRNSSRRYYSLYTVGVTPKCQFIGERAEPIYYKKGNSSSTSFNSRGSSAVNHRDVPNYETVFNESGQQVTFDDLEDNDSVFCERCEVIQGIPCGDSSAKILKREDQWIVYCFNCQETVLKVIKTFQFQPILVEDQEKVILVDRYLNQGFQDVSLSDTYRVFAIDAPTGSGKSFMLKEWINRDDLFYDNIIFIYSKQGLCRAMSSYFQIPCYLDFTAQDWRTPPNKFVICLNSIIKLPRDIKTTAIILDEGGLTRKDTCAVTILPTLKDVLEKMHDLCSNTGKVILTQHNLSQTDLDYYSNFVPNLMDNQIFSRIFTQLGAKHSDIQHSDKLQVILKRIKDLYLESAGRSGKAIVIVGSSASMIRTLTVQLKEWAAEHDFDPNRIKGMWGANQHEEWNKNFLSNPNDDYEVDVLSFTHFIQAGLSIENESYKHKFMLYPISYIDHGLEYQLANRLRIPVPALAYVENGRQDSNEKDVKALTAKYQFINSYNWPSFQIETFAEVECEHRDTIYFHPQKWQQRSADQKTFSFTKLPDSNEPLRMEEGKVLDHHIDCAQGNQKRIYNNLLFRSNNVSIEVYNTQDEIRRDICWDTLESEKTIKTLTKHSRNPDLDFQFIMALCNEKETPSIMTPNLKRLVGQPKKLCHTLDYILSTDHYTDANDYWTEYVALAKRMSRVAQALLIPNIVKVLPIMGITDPQVLFHFEDEKLILKKVDICLKTLVESYLLEDPSFKIYNLVYESEKITYNRHKKTYQICGSKKPKLSTSILVKRFLGHLGLESVTCSLDNGNRSAPIWNQSAKYKIGIPSSKRSFAILSCVYGEHHWGSFQIFAPKIGTFIESNLQVYKQDIIDEHYDKEGEGESLGSQDTLMGDVYTHTRGSSLHLLSTAELASELDTFMEE